MAARVVATMQLPTPLQALSYVVCFGSQQKGHFADGKLSFEVTVLPESFNLRYSAFENMVVVCRSGPTFTDVGDYEVGPRLPNGLIAFSGGYSTRATLLMYASINDYVTEKSKHRH